jgi:hypothetical protein
MVIKIMEGKDWGKEAIGVAAWGAKIGCYG